MGTRTIPGDKLLEGPQPVPAAVPTLALPTDFAAGETPSPAGARAAVTLSRELSERVRALARSQDASLSTVLLAAVQVVLHRYCEQSEIVVGAAIARLEPDDGSAVDLISRPVPVRVCFSADPSFAEVLRQRLPAPQPSSLRVVLAMEEARDVDGGSVAARADLMPIGAHDTRYDLTLLAADTSDGIQIALWYRTALFRAHRAERLLGHLAMALGAAAGQPRRPVSLLGLLSDAERAELAAWNATELDEGAPSTIVAMFEAQVARVPDRVALVSARTGAAHGNPADVTSLTYAELNARANQLARHLQQSGVVAGAPVAMLLDQTAEALVGMLGILKAEGAYMPLPSDAPSARLAQQLAESGAKLVITSAAMASRLPGMATIVPLDSDAATLRAHSTANLPLSARPRDTAYVLFTSGSTGIPKGVAVTHANLVHYTRAVRRVLHTVEDEPAHGRPRQYGLASSLTTDLGNTTLFPALLSGATLHVLGAGVTGDAPRFASYMAAHRLDVLKLAPSRLRALCAGRSGAALAAILPQETLVLGGETLHIDLARVLLDAGKCRVVNHYGPTEATVGALTHEVTSRSLVDAEKLGARTVPLGRPLANTRAYVVGANGQEQPVGVHGELWLGGAGVSNGYLNRPALSLERFVSFRGERVYRTGDRVRRLSDGTLEFLGRTDGQVKVDGERVELGEIELVLGAHPNILQAVVMLREDDGAEPALHAYAVPRSEAYPVDHDDPQVPEKLRRWLAAQLPGHMMPKSVVLLDVLPLTIDGKLDRAALATGSRGSD